MKKLFSFLLAAVMVLAFAACGNNPSKDDLTGKTVVLYTGNLRGDVDVYGQIKAAKDAYEEAGADVILVDAGNFLQGSAAANSSRGAVIYDLMDAVGYDAAAIGLSELSYTDATTGFIYHGNLTKYYTQAMLQDGTEAVEYEQDFNGTVAVLEAREPAKFAALSSNIIDSAGAYSFEPSVEIKTEGGLSILVEGYTDPAAVDMIQDGFADIEKSPAEATYGEYDLTILLSNAPNPEADANNNLIIILAPTGGEKVIGAYIIDNEKKDVKEAKVTLPEADADIAAIAEAAKDAASTVVGKSDVILNGADSVNWNGESNLGDLTADALLWYAENYIDEIDDTLPIVAIQNGGNCDNFIYTGDITELDLLKALPFSPMGIGVLVVTGDQLLETIEASTQNENCPGFAQVAGLKYTLNTGEDYDAGEAYGKFFKADSINRVTITEVGGNAFDPDAKYAVVADNFILNGNDTYYTLADAKAAEDAVYINNSTGVKTRDAVAMYIDEVLGGTIGSDYAEPQGRITVVK